MVRIIPILILLCFKLIVAQPSETPVLSEPPQILTIKVDTPKNTKLAMIFSALLPGTGEYYLNKKTRAYTFWSTELLSWGAFFASVNWREQSFNRALQYARAHGGAPNAPDDYRFLQLMNQYNSRDGYSTINIKPDSKENYNQNQRNQGKSIEEIYPNTPEYQWNWGSPDETQNTQNQSKFKKLLNSHTQSKVVVKAMVGTLVLNRLLSVIDVIRIGKSTHSFQINAGFLPNQNYFLIGRMAI